MSLSKWEKKQATECVWCGQLLRFIVTHTEQRGKTLRTQTHRRELYTRNMAIFLRTHPYIANRFHCGISLNRIQTLCNCSESVHSILISQWKQFAAAILYIYLNIIGRFIACFSRDSFVTRRQETKQNRILVDNWHWRIFFVFCCTPEEVFVQSKIQNFHLDWSISFSFVDIRQSIWSNEPGESKYSGDGEFWAILNCFVSSPN